MTIDLGYLCKSLIKLHWYLMFQFRIALFFSLPIMFTRAFTEFLFFFRQNTGTEWKKTDLLNIIINTLVYRYWDSRLRKVTCAAHTSIWGKFDLVRINFRRFEFFSEQEMVKVEKRHIFLKLFLREFQNKFWIYWPI